MKTSTLVPQKSMKNLTDIKSKVILKNAFFSFFIKAANISLNFLMLPLVLSFINSTEYGIWLTLTAILSWFSLFDLGLGNGLRNHLAIALSKNDINKAKIYVSTTYAILSLILLAVLILFWILFPHLSWTKIFNAPQDMEGDVSMTALISISLLFIQFIFRLVNTILLAHQKAAIADFVNVLIQVFIFAGILILRKFNLSSIVYLSIVYSISPIVVFLFISLLLFSRSYSNIRPSFRHIKLVYAKSLMNLGIGFFVIQIAALVLYASNNFIIAQLFSPSDVTVYNVAFKYFSITNIFFTVILSPFWSMVTKAYAEGDYSWIKKAMNKLLLIWCLIVVTGIIQLTFSNQIYSLWLNNKVEVPWRVSAIMLLYFIVLNWGVIFANFLNGLSKIRVQLYYSVFGMIFNIAIALYLVKVCKIGIIGVPIATIITMIGSNALGYVQYKKIIAGKGIGVWNK